MANNQRRLEDLLDELFDLIDNAGSVPVIGAFMGGKVLVDGETARQIIDDIRDVMPEEINEARSVLEEERKFSMTLTQRQRESSRRLSFRLTHSLTSPKS